MVRLFTSRYSVGCHLIFYTLLWVLVIFRLLGLNSSRAFQISLQLFHGLFVVYLINEDWGHICIWWRLWTRYHGHWVPVPLEHFLLFTWCFRHHVKVMNCNLVILAWTRHQGQFTHCLINLHSFALVESVSLSLYASIRLSVDTTDCRNTSFRFDLLFEIPFVYLSFHCLDFWKNMLLALLSSFIECHKVVYILLCPALLLSVLEAFQAHLNFAAWESDRPVTSLVHLNHLLAV